MSEWQETTLGALLSKKGYIRGPFGSTLKRTEMLHNGIPVYEQQHAIYQLREFRYFINEEKFEELKRFQVKTGDLIISCSGTVGRVSMINANDPKGIISQALLLLRPDTNKIKAKYLEYFFNTRMGFNKLVQASHGSVQINIAPRKMVESISIKVPFIETQERIVGIISTLDDKIDLLRRQNETLEKMAQALFKRWFVDFNFPDEAGKPYKSSGGIMQPSELGEIPQGWKVGSVGSEFKITMGQSPKGESFNKDNEGMIFFQGRTDFGFRFPKIRLYTTEPNRIAEKFDVLVSVRAPVGDINVAFEKCCIGRGLSAVSSKYKSYCNCKMKSFEKFFRIYEKEGTVFGSINKETFNNLENIIPPTNIISEFDRIIKPIDLKIYENEKHIITLTELRDGLLPKLMSGKIRVKE